MTPGEWASAWEESVMEVMIRVYHEMGGELMSGP